MESFYLKVKQTAIGHSRNWRIYVDESKNNFTENKAESCSVMRLLDFKRESGRTLHLSLKYVNNINSFIFDLEALMKLKYKSNTFVGTILKGNCL